MSNPEAVRRVVKKDIIAAKFQILRDVVYGLAHDRRDPKIRDGLINSGNTAIGGLGLTRVVSGMYETFTEDGVWQERTDSGIGVVKELRDEDGIVYLYYARDGRSLRAPVRSVSAIVKERASDSALRDA